jgi:hypothetical protein
MQQIASPVSSRTSASLVASWVSAAVSGSTATASATFLQQLLLPAVFAQQYGAPADMWLNVTVTVDGEAQMNLQLFNKTSTRPHPASLWTRWMLWYDYRMRVRILSQGEAVL